MHENDLAILLFWLTLFATFGVEAVKAETYARRLSFGILAGLFLLFGLLWQQLKGLWPALNDLVGRTATDPVTWFAMFIFIVAVFAFGPPVKLERFRKFSLLRSPTAIPATTLTEIDKRLDELGAKIEAMSRNASPIESTFERLDKGEQAIAQVRAELGQISALIVRKDKDTEAILSRLNAADSGIAQNKAVLLTQQAMMLEGTRNIHESLEQLRAQFDSIRKHSETNVQMLVTAFRARDAEAILKEADETAMSLAPKLMQGAYPDEKAWTADYTIWKAAISRIDSVASSWQGERHTSYLDIRLTDMESGGPTPPTESNIKSSEGVMRYRTVWKVQQSWANHRDHMFRLFDFKAGELPG